ncbi:uncharacterized protein Z519_09745 [Cladophialophora bantiana CBS 173.52]|uniref:Uncharacterized protein n=1 Tax=Cladophialophora bantiana (strain ATCC 10958 / CBS 173.52 / CDC B-1940 / NIH 8579) TaxID=1442370 RepID=A0A0D2HYE5_CLAB1|nr:uncharacterized protein Z519_09745 [Cladophialophora bantiana CBS 173.52]KIW89589.1 hypothetical protein Z519_09745 [Cladophialophora bantiana CBS 173.52]
MADLSAPEQPNLTGSATPKETCQDLHNLTECILHPYQEGDGFTPTSPTRQVVAARRARSSRILDRISFARSRGIRDRALEELEARQRDEQRAEAKARKEGATQERKARRQEDYKKREAKRQESKDRARQNNKDKAERKAQEKRVQDYYGIRGYDPSAGMLRANRDRAALRTTNGQVQIPWNIDEVLNSRPQTSQTWGVEYGKPNEEHGKGRHSPL